MIHALYLWSQANVSTEFCLYAEHVIGTLYNSRVPFILQFILFSSIAVLLI